MPLNPPEIRVGDNSALSPTFTATINNVIIGSNGLNKTGEGRLILTADNSYSGSTLLSAGVLSVSNDNNLGNSANSLNFAGGTQQAPFQVLTAR